MRRGAPHPRLDTELAAPGANRGGGAAWHGQQSQPVAWLAVGPLLATLVLPVRITAVLAGWVLLLSFGLIVDRPGRPGRLASHRGVLVLLAALIKVSVSRT